MRYDASIHIEEKDDVYSPDEDSILLIESLDVYEGERILEIGCGSGIVAIHCAKNGAVVTAVDINPSAVALTMKNAAANGTFMDVRLSDLYENTYSDYDTVVFNLPYLPVSDNDALGKAWSGGDDGMGPLPKLLNEAIGRLYPGGRLVIVVSSLMDQCHLDDVLRVHKITVLGEKKISFELLRVLEIRL